MTFVRMVPRVVMPDGVMHDFRQDEYRGVSCQAVLCMTFVREPENQRTKRALPVDICYRQRPSYMSRIYRQILFSG